MKYNNLQSLDKTTKIIKRGITPKYTNNKKINVINQRCIRNGIVNFEFVKFHDSNKKVQKEKYLQDYDVLVNSTGVGTLGRVAQFKKYDNKAYTVDSHVTIVRPIDEIDKLYFGYAIKEKEPFIASMGEGSTGQTELSRFRLGEEVFINVPSLDKQKKIALTLFSIDKKIEVNNKIIANLEEQAQAIFKSWFVDFEPFQDGNFVESELGMIPEGWEVKELGDFMPVVTGKKNANIANNNGEYPFFTCSQEIFKTNDYSFNANAILLAGNGDFNVKRYNGKFEAYQRTYVLIPNNYKHVGWLYNLIKYFLRDIVSGYKGSVINYITKGMIENFRIAVPRNIDELNVLSIFNDFELMISNIDNQNKKLAEIRDALLPKLMSGEIDVSNIKIKGEEVKNE